MASVFTHTYLTKLKRKSRLKHNRICYVAGPKLQARKKARMGKDKRGVLRGKCLECPECDEYETTGTASILCEYCGHRPVEHELIKSAEETTPAKNQG